VSIEPIVTTTGTTGTVMVPVVHHNDTAMSFDLLVRQADVLASSRIIPRAYQNRPADVIAAGLAGFAFGWDVMTSLRNYHVIEGTASLRPEAMLGLVRRSGHSVQLAVFDAVRDELPVRVAKATGRRRDNGDEHIAEFDTIDAKRAGLINKNNWKQYEDAMLTWRAVSALCRVLFPDVVLGAGYVPEELGATVTATGEIVEADPFAPVLIPSSQAKTAVLNACDGDKDRARSVWGDRGSNSVTQDELDQMIATITTTPVEQIVDAEIVESSDSIEQQAISNVLLAFDMTEQETDHDQPE